MKLTTDQVNQIDETLMLNKVIYDDIKLELTDHIASDEEEILTNQEVSYKVAIKLDKQQIQFIDTYLKNNNVIYIDIRQEMLDHIASDVEEKMSVDNLDFYEAFKSFLAVHKGEVLYHHKRDWTISWVAIKEFVFFLTKPFMLVTGILMFLFYQNIDVNSYFAKDFTIKNMFFIFILCVALFQGVYLKVYLKKRFYTVDKTANVLVIIYYIKIIILPTFTKENVSAITLTVSSYLVLGYILFFIKRNPKVQQAQI